MKPWHLSYQLALHRLLRFYRDGKKLDYCPLCHADNKVSSQNGDCWGDCSKCPWTIMTGKDCDEHTFSGTSIKGNALRSDYEFGLKADETKIAVPQRIAQLEEWIQYWREASDESRQKK